MNLKIRFGTLPLACAITLLILTTWSEGEAVSSIDDGIVIVAEAAKGNDGKTHIVCSITNKSPYILASVHQRTESLCFQVRLQDSAGHYLLQNVEWGWNQSQVGEVPGYDGSINSKSVYVKNIMPSEKAEFAFDLEDAYDGRAVLGRVLEVTWRNYYPDGKIIIDERRYGDGTIIPAHQEITHFQGSRTFSVSLPLPKAETETKAPVTAEKPVGVETQLPEVPAVNPRQKPAKSTAESAPNHWWWLLLAIPLIFLIWKSVRWKRQS